MTTRLAPEAMVNAGREVERLMRARGDAYAVDLTEQAGGNILVAVSYISGGEFRFHVDPAGGGALVSPGMLALLRRIERDTVRMATQEARAMNQPPEGDVAI